MPAFPVGRGGIKLNGDAAPAAAIINNGPGLLYLYRNSAVSTFAYDTVIGPSGSFQWPGGELWAASDSATTVNVLAGLSAFDSGTTQVAGTVNVTSGAGAVGPRVKGANSVTNPFGSSVITCVTPQSTSAGDLLVAYTYNTNSETNGAPSPYQAAEQARWTYVGGSNGMAVYKRTATADDAGRGSNWQDTFQAGSATDVVYIVAFANATTVRVTTVVGGTTGPYQIYTGNSIAPELLTNIQPGGSILAWGNAANGAPSPNDPWTRNGAFGVSKAVWAATGNYPVNVGTDSGSTSSKNLIGIVS